LLPTSFRLRVNLQVKTIVFKTQKNSRLKTRYLKRITVEQLFIISIKRLSLKSILFEQKNKLLYTLSFYFISNLKIIPIYIELKRNSLFYFMVMHLFIIFNSTFKSSKVRRGKKYLARYMEDAFPPS
jgi:hypothetical protein